LPDWTAELVVDEDLARRLLRQFPELALESLRSLSEGWDYTIWVVDEAWAFRFPRREVVVPGTLRELATLPQLAPLLPIAVPEPVYVGESTGEFPWPFYGSRLLPGRELGEAELGDDARVDLGISLARFLSVLHAADVAHDLPTDANRRADMSSRVPKTRAQLAELSELGLWRQPASVGRLLDDAEQLTASDRSVVVHGDLHFRQILVDDEGQPTGVIDWVDVCRSDPAIDLSLLWSYLPPAAREGFLAEYGAVAEDQLVRARVIALSLSAALAQYGHREHFPAIEREALAGLERATTD
jgi:aminoglycoside phosphotransferase (APT) family kinase protein